VRAVVQRVACAKVEVDGEVTGSIERGLLVYLGAGKGDRSVVDVGGGLLVVSQFTLYADLRRGRRPGFDDAMPPEEAERAYDAFVREARAHVPALEVETGRFRAHMRVTSLNDGPVTLWIDSAKIAP
jgi:D-tyrosyl-tRNA(Tyr) deacylase